MGFRGFDSGKIRTLAGDLQTLADDASPLHMDVSSVLNRAHGAMASGPATYNDDLERVRTHAVTDLLFGGLPSIFGGGGGGTLPGDLNGELSGMSDEIGRRVEQLEGVRELAEAGYAVSDCTLFLDEDPPSQQDIEDAVEFFENLEENDVSDWDNREALLAAMEDLEGLSAAELDAVVSQVPADQLAQYNEILNRPRLLGINGISYEERTAHLSNLLAEVGQDNLDKFMDAFPGVQPDYSNGKYLDGDEEWGVPNQPMFNDSGEVSVEDIGQGDFGDCWYLASLAALTQSNPEYIQEGIRENPNGTVSVRLWDAEGNEQWVTVDRQLPLNPDGSPATASRDGQPLWAAYYEKAFVQVYGEDPRGTYNAIEGDWSGNAVPHLTGGEAENIGGSEFLGFGSSDYDNVKEAFENGRAVTLSSTGDAPEGWEDLGYTDGHAYYVVGFTEDGNVLVGNPWGASYEPIECTPDEFNDAFDDPTAIDVPQ